MFILCHKIINYTISLSVCFILLRCFPRINVFPQVVINNCALNREYMCNIKQIKLLIKPLSLKFSRRDDVAKKRLEVWVLLLDKLQESCVKCLKEFIGACYGPSNFEIVKPLSFNEITEGLVMKKTHILIKLLGKTDCVLEIVTIVRT